MFYNPYISRDIPQSKLAVAALRSIQNPIFPAYNILSFGEQNYTIELAVAGYQLGAFVVTFDGQTLAIDCDPARLSPEVPPVFFHQGFTYEKWSRDFAIAACLEISGPVTLINGMLRIKLKRSTAHDQKTVRLDIVQAHPAPTARSHPQLLNEDSVL